MAVSAFTSGQHVFVIEITSINGTVVLYDGQPQDGIVAAGATQYYNLTFPVIVSVRLGGKWALLLRSLQRLLESS